jgi:hypothetical protein
MSETFAFPLPDNSVLKYEEGRGGKYIQKMKLEKNDEGELQLVDF